MYIKIYPRKQRTTTKKASERYQSLSKEEKLKKSDNIIVNVTKI